MPDRSDSAATILSNALELPREARRAYVGRACAGNEGLRREVESLLSAYEAAGDTLDPKRARLDMQSAMAANDLPPGHRIGAYALQRLLATGGMGAVYLAERSDAQYEKRVAIKLVKPMLTGTEALLGRFRTERQVLASLDHPNIARLLDGGATEDGVPYIVMEYVDGQAIDSYCNERSLSVDERLRLFLAVCEAVGAAHRSLVVHRDLKPSNVLVNQEGEVKLLDFGLAKLLDEKGASDQAVTRLRLLTPRYASPEQVRGDSVTTATDVYSLGVLLYELVTGRLPYDGSTEADWEMERAICEKEPSPASSVVGDRASRRSLRGDLDAILATALSKNPSDRYASATELAADLRRHLTGLPVLARPDTIRYRTWMLVRRNKTLVAAVLSVIVALGVGLVLAMTQYWRAEERTEMAQRLAYSAAIAAAEGALRANQLQSAERFLAQAPLRLRGWEWSLIHRRLDQSSSAWQAHDHWVTDLTITADGRRLVSGSYDGTVKIWEFPSGELVRTLALDSREADDEIVWEHGVLDLCLVPDGRTLVVGYVRQREEGNPIVWDMETGEVLGRGDRFLEWGQVAVHPRDDLLAVGSLAGNVELTPIVDPRTSVETLHPAVVAGSHSESPQHRRVNALCFQPGGELLATGKYQVELWDAHTWERVAALPVMGYGVDRIAFSPDGRNLAADVSGGSIVVWDVTTGRAALTIGVQEEGVHALAYSVGGDEIYTAGDDGRLVAWDAETGSIRRVHRGHRVPVRSLALAPDGRRVASGDEQGVIRVWDMASGDVPTWYLEQDWRPRWALQACVTPDGRYALGPAANGGVLAWDFSTHRVAGELSAFERCGLRSVVFSGDGKRMAVIHLSGAVTVLDVRDGDTAKLFLADRSDVVAAAAHPSRDLFVTAGTDSTVRVWSFDGGEEVSDPLHHAASPSSVCFTPDGSRLLVGDADGVVSVWSCASWRRVGHFVAAQQAVTDVAISPDGHLVASVSLDGTTALRHLGDEEARIVLPDETVHAVTFTGAGGRLLAGAETGTLHVIDVSTGAQILQFDAHDRAILDLAYSSSGDMVISASRDGTLRTWASEAIESQHPSPFAGLTKGVAGAGRDSSRASGTQPANGTIVGSWTAALGTEEAVGAPGGRLENGASIETVSGRPAFHFDGPTEVLGVSDPPRCVPEAQAFTVMARVRPREGGSGTVLSCQRSSFDTSAGGWAVRVLDSVEKARSLVTYNRRIVELPLPSEDRFTHLAVTYEPGEETLSVFVDGALAHSTRVPVEAMRSPDAPLRIGRAAYTSRLGFDAFAGSIDDVRVYAGAMSEEEVRKAMQASPSSRGAAAIVQDR